MERMPEKKNDEKKFSRSFENQQGDRDQPSNTDETKVSFFL